MSTENTTAVSSATQQVQQWAPVPSSHCSPDKVLIQTEVCEEHKGLKRAYDTALVAWQLRRVLLLEPSLSAASRHRKQLLAARLQAAARLYDHCLDCILCKPPRSRKAIRASCTTKSSLLNLYCTPSLLHSTSVQPPKVYEFSKHIGSICARAGVNAYDLAPRLGVLPTELLEMINGAVKPTKAVVRGLARELNSDVRYLERLAAEIEPR